MTEWNPDNPADLRIWDDVMYEVSAFNKSKLARQACTSIVAEAPNGTIYHGRNLDYSRKF